jgi:transposase
MLWHRGKAYSQDLRQRVFAAADDGEPVGRIAELLRVSVSYVSKVLSRRRRNGADHSAGATLSCAAQTY